MGVHARENLRMADGFFKDNETNVRKVIEVIRKYQPEIVLCNAIEDRHPDHGRSASWFPTQHFLQGFEKLNLVRQ
jgi:LmbE family N-acetylglucosaminyl deacetylase